MHLLAVPQDLIDIQHQLHQVQHWLRPLYRSELPEAFLSPWPEDALALGLTPKDHEQQRKLEARVVELAATTHSDRYWSTFSGPDVPAARSMGALLADVRQRAQQGDEACPVLSRKLCRQAESDLGQAIFDAGLPALDMDVDQVVFSVSHLQLPTERELEQPQLFAQLPREKLFGRAALCLIAAVTSTWPSPAATSSPHACGTSAGGLCAFRRAWSC